MSNGDRTRIPIQHMPSGHFAIGDNLGGPDDNTPDMEPVLNAPGWYRPAPSAPYAIHNRVRRDVVPPTARPDEGDQMRQPKRTDPRDGVLTREELAVLDKPTVARRTAGYLEHHVATVRNTLAAPIRLERMARAIESGDTAQITAAIDETARTVVTHLAGELGCKEMLTEAILLIDSLTAAVGGLTPTIDARIEAWRKAAGS